MSLDMARALCRGAIYD